jgi:hypothetical protein
MPPGRPGRPPKRKGTSHPQSASSHTSTSDPRLSENANTAANHIVQAPSPSQSSSPWVSGAQDDNHYLTPFLNTTFSTHRLSPLYIGSQPLTQDRIQALSHRLRDFLVGHVVRGIEVGLDRPADDGAMARAGALEAVSISWIIPDEQVASHPGQRRQQDAPAPEPSITRAESGDHQIGNTPGRTKGIQISLQYEHAECAALLLPSALDGENPVEDMPAAVEQAPSAPAPLLDLAPGRPVENDSAFLRLPLLLMRMPSTLKVTIIEFLSRNFDCRVSPLNLGTRSLVRALEKWTDELGVGAQADSAKDVVLTIGFCAQTVMRCRRWRQPREQQHKQQDIPQDEQTEFGEQYDSETSDSALGVKSIDVIIPSADLVRLVRAGKGREATGDEPPSQTRDKCKRAGVQFRDPYVEAKRRKFGGDKDEEGWTWRQKSAAAGHRGSTPQPFTDTLAQYVLQHLALDIFHPAVRISKVACGGFVLSEGRVKIFGVPPSVGADRDIPDGKQTATSGVLNVLLDKACVEPPGEKTHGMLGSLST